MLKRVLTGLLLLGSPLGAQQFVQVVPLVPGTASPGTPLQAGYLRLTITSQLAPLAASVDLLSPKGFMRAKPELLAVTVGVTVTGGEVALYPVALYDLKNRIESTVASLQLGRAQFISLAGGAPQPTLTFQVRAVPKDLAAGFRSAVIAMDNIVNIPVAATLVPIAPQITAATKLLASFLGPSEQQHPEWKSEKRIGLGPGPLEVVPLDGRIAILFLRPMRKNLQLPAYGDLAVCTSSPTEICLRSTGQPYSVLPYLLLRAEVLSYRELNSSGAPVLSCLSTEADAELVVKTAASVALTPDQRQLEEILLDRFRLVLAAKKGLLQTDPGAADLAYRWAQRDDGTAANALWTTNGAGRAMIYDQCFDNAVTNRGLAESRRWKIYRAAFETAANWRSTASPVQAQLEGFLEAILKPIAAFGLKEGPANAMLRDEQGRIEALLLPIDQIAIQAAAAASDLASLRTHRKSLESRRTTTNCERCRDVLTAAIGQVDTRVASLERANVATVAAAAAEKGELADAQQNAKQVILVVEAVTPGANTDGLKQQTAVAAQVLSDRAVSADSVRAVTAKLQQSVESTKQNVVVPLHL